MGLCRICNKPAGLFKNIHLECETQEKSGLKAADIRKRAFDSVLDQIQIEGTLKEKLWKTVLNIQDMLEEEKIFQEILGNADCKWPDFEQWEQTFGERKDKKVPAMWELLDDIEKGIHFYRQQLARLVCHTYHMTNYSLQVLDGVQDLKKSGIRFRLKAQVLPLKIGGCSIENEYAHKFNRGEIEGYPPFFPGDRTGLEVDTL